MKNRHFWSAAIAALLMLITAASAAAADSSTLAYVTIANGELLVAREPVSVTDEDGDGALTINDAIISAHKQLYPGGADGYRTATMELGVYITRLWGVENGGSYGYYKNDQMAMSLFDPVSSGDHVVAFAYTDPTGFSDVYTYFDKSALSAKPGDDVELTLSMVGFDENFMPVSLPLEGAAITVDGKATEYKTDAAGKVKIKLGGEGKHVISAVSASKRIVPPVCVAEVVGAPQTGGAGIILAAAAAMLAGAGIYKRRK